MNEQKFEKISELLHARNNNFKICVDSEEGKAYFKYLSDKQKKGFKTTKPMGHVETTL